MFGQEITIKAAKSDKDSLELINLRPGPLKGKILQLSLRAQRRNLSYVARPSIPTPGRDIIGLLFSQPGFRIRMGWAAKSASRHPDSTSIRASA